MTIQLLHLSKKCNQLFFVQNNLDLILKIVETVLKTIDQEIKYVLENHKQYTFKSSPICDCGVRFNLYVSTIHHCIHHFWPIFIRFPNFHASLNFSKTFLTQNKLVNMPKKFRRFLTKYPKQIFQYNIKQESVQQLTQWLGGENTHTRHWQSLVVISVRF